MTYDSDQSVSEKHAPGLVSRIRTYFLTGLVVAGPAAVTLWLIWWFVTWVDNLVRPLIPVDYRPETYLPIKIPGTGLIIVFVALTLLGFLTANFIGRKLVASSGSPNLDIAVMTAITEAAPYPAPPNWSPISLNYNFGRSPRAAGGH